MKPGAHRPDMSSPGTAGAPARFHPAVERWFARAVGTPTEPQARGWPAIQQRRHTLIAAPTGSGKTLAAFLAAIDDLVRQGLEGSLETATQVLYVSPLKALSNDIQRNLALPLAGIREELAAMGLPPVELRTFVRTGDTPASQRTASLKRPPHIYVTTPESLYILLTTEKGRNLLRTVHTVIVDEIHAMVGDKRGSHLALSLERLEALAAGREPQGSLLGAGRPGLVRIGLSATQKPVAEVARFLVGAAHTDAAGEPECTVVDTGHRRELDLAVELPASPLEAVMSLEVWEEVYGRLAELIEEHRTTLVFVNTRRLAERATRHLAERLGEDRVTSHHGSLSREHRHAAEQRLKAGELRALVATASLELGIDIGSVDLVCQVGSTRAISTLLQRAGRSGHRVGALARARLFPLTRDELVECAALLDAVQRGELDRLELPEAPLDILAQQVVAAVAAREWREDDLYALVRRAHPYRALSRQRFEAVVQMLAEGITTRRGRRGALLHRDAVHGRLRPRRGARLAAITSGGAIPDNADYEVVQEPGGLYLGTLNEDFAIESMAGDIFQLGNRSWRILRVEPGRVRVEDAGGQPPTIPFWFGEAPGRTPALSAAVARLREAVAERLGDLSAAPALPGGSRAAAADNAPGVPFVVEGDGGAAEPDGGAPEPVAEAAAPAPDDPLSPGAWAGTAVEWLAGAPGLPRAAAEQIAEYLAAGRAVLGAMPTQRTLVLERFFDETGGMQLVLHSPFGSRLNRAWGLALRKRFCRKFNFELQAAAGEDAIVLSLGPTHSFPLEEVYRYLNARTVRDVLTQAVLDAPMFTTRWRWNATRSLAVLRWRGGRKVAPQLQRIEAENLIAAVFPDQLACLENVAGNREIPDHPLVTQTLHDCLTEGMDIEGLEALLADMERGGLRLLARDLPEPSPLAHEILNARPYAFLDDAPLEERRTQAVASRRWLDPQRAAEIGSLDAAAIDRVRAEAWPQAESADELHDALVLLGTLTDAEVDAARHPLLGDGEAPAGGWRPLVNELVAQRRLTRLRPEGDGPALWVPAERLPQADAVWPGALAEPPLEPPSRLAREWNAAEALVELVRGRLEGLGPVGESALAEMLGLPARRVQAALLALEGEGFALRGRFSPGAAETEWCDRRLLARIHRYTLHRLRAEIEPVSARDFLRFLFRWQRVAPGHQAGGEEGLAAVLDQLEGFEAPAGAWEAELLAARLEHYDPGWLDGLCLAGRTTWQRLTPPGQGRPGRSWGPVRATPVALLGRPRRRAWQALVSREAAPPEALSATARQAWAHLREAGASFFDDVVAGAGLLPTQAEQALGELAAQGWVTADSFQGLRALLTPADRRPPVHGARRRGRGGGAAFLGMARAGRWSLLPRPPARNGDGLDGEAVETVARALLQRYGVVFRRLLEREGPLPPWRDLLRVYRRREARGEIRGGRFVAGFSGEQFALPEAVGTLREVRRQRPGGEWVTLSAADPLNLLGIVLPGSRLPALAANRVVFRDGEPVAAREGGRVRPLADLDGFAAWEAEQRLQRRRPAAALPRSLGRSG